MTLDIPPSTNALYQKRSRASGGGLALTDKAKAYQRHVRKVIGTRVAELASFPVDLETIFEAEIILYFPSVENAGWFQRISRGPNKGQRKAKTRYKKIDYDNRIKFLQDCVVKSIGIPDDSQIFRGLQEKREDKENPRAEVVINVLSRDGTLPERR